MKPGWTGRAAVVVVGIAVVIGGLRGTVGLLELDYPRRIMMGFATSTAALSVNDPQPAFALAEKLPAEAVVFFVAEPRIFRFPRRLETFSQHDVTPLRFLIETTPSAEAVRSELRARGFSHLLVNWGELARLGPNYPVAPWSTMDGQRRWVEFVRSLGPPVIEWLPVQVFCLQE